MRETIEKLAEALWTGAFLCLLIPSCKGAGSKNKLYSAEITFINVEKCRGQVWQSQAYIELKHVKHSATTRERPIHAHVLGRIMLVTLYRSP
jgi:hypothetical protein